MSNNTNNTNTTKYTLLVPFEDKDIVKKHGGEKDRAGTRQRIIHTNTHVRKS